MAESVAAQEETGADLPEWIDDLVSSEPNDPETIPWEGSSRSAPAPEQSDPPPEPDVEFPHAAAWEVALGAAGEPAVVPEPVAEELGVESAEELPVVVTPGIEAPADNPLEVEVFGRSVAEQVGVSGFVFSLSGIDADALAPTVGAATDGEGVAAEAAAAPATVPAELTLDYSGFALAYGGDYATRLQVVALPDCVLEDPIAASCQRTGVRLPVTNDYATQKLTVQVGDLASLAQQVQLDPAAVASPEAVAAQEIGEPGAAAEASPANAAASGDSSALVLAVTSGLNGDVGAYQASPTSISGEWQVGAGSGEFSWSYPMGAPAPGGGAAPPLGLGYSSAAIDGLTLATNPQASPSGLGWSDFANAYIERSYEPCAADPGWFDSFDLCWKSENASITLNGVSSALLPVGTDFTKWRLQSDPGWTVERRSGANFTDIHGTQYWVVTGPDGTQYFFGWGHGPGRPTNSILGVGVVADQAGEPCYNAQSGLGGCSQGWRWYLDRIVDPDGMTTVFQYERDTNYYDAANGLFGRAAYHSGAVLKEVVYGGEGPRGWDHRTYAGKITFDTYYRCRTLNESCTTAPVKSSGWEFWDTPTDLICSSDPGVACGVSGPSFFTTRRYATVKTWVAQGGAPTTGPNSSWDAIRWAKVTEYALRHSFGPGTASMALKLQLEGIQRKGVAFSSSITMPEVTFGYTMGDNRADNSGDPVKAMRHNRLTSVTNEYGGRVTAQYGFNRQCTGTYTPTGPDGTPDWWDRNYRDCFPQSQVDDNHLRQGRFYKYIVLEVREIPEAGNPSSEIVTTYSYEGDPAWVFDDTAFARDEDHFGWTVWRGYGSTVITTGTSRTRVRSFRGLDGDWELFKNGSGDFVTVYDSQRSDVDGLVDHPEFAGRPREEQRLGAGTSVPQSTLYTYRNTQTLPPAPPYLYGAERAVVETVAERVAVPTGGFRERRSVTSYNANFQAASTFESGWTGEERCTLTTYADDLARNMVTYPASNTTVVGNDNGTCDQSRVLTTSQTYYDGSTTLGAAPTRGRPTRQRALVDAVTQTWAQTDTEFDDMGRPTKVTDPRGGVTTTAYRQPSTFCRGSCDSFPPEYANQSPERTIVTNPAGHAVTTNWKNEYAVPSAQTDANAHKTTFGYDALGRTVWVKQPTEQPAGSPESWLFSYDIPNRAVRSSRLTSGSGTSAVREDTWVIYDGFGRERQTQSVSPASTQSAPKVLIAETTYDNRGLVQDSRVAQAFNGTPSRYIDGGPGHTWKNQTQHVYDELGRETQQIWWHNGSMSLPTTTEYRGDTVVVTGPDGVQVSEQVDGFGRTVARQERDGQNMVTSTYGYDLLDRLVSVRDPEGNQISYGYNNAGQRTSQEDPNRGSASFTYDLAGNQTSLTDSLGNSVHTIYDGLNRPTERHSGSATGPLLASWTYDTATKGKGLPHRTTTHTAQGNWVTEVTGYDSRGRAQGSTLTVPTGIPGLSGSYTTTTEYDLADRVTKVSYAIVGDLAAETVTTTYNNLGLATTLAGTNTYVAQANYDDRGRPSVFSQGPAQSDGWMLRSWSYDADQRLAENTVRTSNGTAYQMVGKHGYTYRNDGNLTERTTDLNGAQRRECYQYDPRARLTESYTVAMSTTCSNGTRGSGQQPYNHSYRYSAGGNMTQRIENNTTTTNYAYPAAGGPRPNAPTQVGADTFSWNTNGQLTQRTVGGQTETFSWDVQGLLQSVTGPSGQTSFVYDSSGQRLLRTTPQGRTLYVAGHEVTANLSGSSVKAVRSYSFNGELIATRTVSGVDYMVIDGAGSVEMAIPSGGTPNATRAYDPYGRVRSSTGTMPTNRGFLGQMEDGSTSLSYLNARYYDSKTGVFISADPVVSAGNVKSLNPYSYGAGNPANFSDPSGLSPMYTYGLEVQNGALRRQNSQLVGHIEYLNGKLLEAQGIINEQARVINELFMHIGALEAIIAEQQSIIGQLQAQVAHLKWVVQQQRIYIGKLLGKISYYEGVITQLVPLAYRPEFHAPVFASIWSGRGVPNLWFGTYQAAYFASEARFSEQLSITAGLRSTVASQTYEISVNEGLLAYKNDRIDYLTNDRDIWADMALYYWDEYQRLTGLTDPSEMDSAGSWCYYWTGSGNFDTDYDGDGSSGFWDDFITTGSAVAQWTPLSSIADAQCLQTGR